MADDRDVFTTSPAEPRPLHLGELATLRRLGFPELARRLTCTRCEVCGGHPEGVLHKDTCMKFGTPTPAAAVHQPWQPRVMGARHAA